MINSASASQNVAATSGPDHGPHTTCTSARPSLRGRAGCGGWGYLRDTHVSVPPVLVRLPEQYVFIRRVVRSHFRLPFRRLRRHRGAHLTPRCFPLHESDQSATSLRRSAAKARLPEYLGGSRHLRGGAPADPGHRQADPGPGPAHNRHQRRHRRDHPRTHPRLPTSATPPGPAKGSPQPGGRKKRTHTHTKARDTGLRCPGTSDGAASGI